MGGDTLYWKKIDVWGTKKCPPPSDENVIMSLKLKTCGNGKNGRKNTEVKGSEKRRVQRVGRG